MFHWKQTFSISIRVMPFTLGKPMKNEEMLLDGNDASAEKEGMVRVRFLLEPSMVNDMRTVCVADVDVGCCCPRKPFHLGFMDWALGLGMGIIRIWSSWVRHGGATSRPARRKATRD